MDVGLFHVGRDLVEGIFVWEHHGPDSDRLVFCKKGFGPLTPRAWGSLNVAGAEAHDVRQVRGFEFSVV